MPLQLAPRDEEMLAGRYGDAVRMAMSIIVQMAEVEGATELMDVTRVHIDGLCAASVALSGEVTND